MSELIGTIGAITLAVCGCTDSTKPPTIKPGDLVCTIYIYEYVCGKFVGVADDNCSIIDIGHSENIQSCNDVKLKR